MTELKIKIEDQYVAAFLNFLETLSYVEVENLGAGNATIEALIKESGYKKTDWAKVTAHAEKMDIQESTEELLAQLTA